MLQSDFFQDGPLVGAQRDPDALQWLSHPDVADVLWARDVGGRLGQPEAAFRAALAADQASPAELGQDRLQELPRDVLGARQLLRGDVTAFGGGRAGC